MLILKIQPAIQRADMESGGDLLSRAVTSQVPSALKGLTSVFGMGTGVTPSSLPPEMVSYSLLNPSTGALRSLRAPGCLADVSPVFPLENGRPLQSSFSSSSRAPDAFAPSQLHSDFSGLTYIHLISFSRNQALDLLVSSSSIRYRTSTDDLSTRSSSGGLTCLRNGSLLLEVGFTLRCLQRLSHPHFASLLCRWHDNSCTSDASIPVLSY